MGSAPFHEHIFAFPVFFHVGSLWTVETPTRPCLACEFGVLGWVPRLWLLWGPGRREPGPLRAGFPRPGGVLWRPSWRRGPRTDGTSSPGQLSPLHGCPELPGGGKRHFARWFGSLSLPVACTTTSAQQTHGCLFPDMVPVPRRLLINVCSVTDQVRLTAIKSEVR